MQYGDFFSALKTIFFYMSFLFQAIMLFSFAERKKGSLNLFCLIYFLWKKII